MIELFRCDVAARVLLGSELSRNREERHDRCVVDAVCLHLVENLDGVGEGFGHVGKHLVHLLARLEPLLLGVEHTVGVVQIFSRGETEQMVVRLGIVLVHEVCVVRTNQLYAVFLGELYEYAVCLLLQGEGLTVGALVGVFHLMALQLQIVVVAEHSRIPFNGLPRSGYVVLQNLCRHLSGDTCRAYDKVFVVFLQIRAVGSRTHVESVHPSPRHELYQVLVAVVVLCQHDEVVSALVHFRVGALQLASPRHIHLAAEDGLELRLAFVAELAVHLVAVVEQLLHSEHVAVVGYRHTLHAVGYRLVHELGYARLSVEDAVVCMYVKMNEVLHADCELYLSGKQARHAKLTSPTHQNEPQSYALYMKRQKNKSKICGNARKTVTLQSLLIGTLH